VAFNKYFKLFLSILFDGIGLLSYAIPGLAEGVDVAWAPISFVLMITMYRGKVGKISGVISFLEEILPATDVIPTFTLTWLYVYVYEAKTQSDNTVIIND